jgi:hypothetical protein
MAEANTLSGLLKAQPMGRLVKLRKGIVAEIDKLNDELRHVDAAMESKRSEMVAPQERTAKKRTNGGLPRSELLKHVADIGRPVKPPEMRDALAAKGIDRTVEAVRISLARLQRDGSLVRDADGSFAVPRSNGNGNGAKVEAGGHSSLESGQP